MSKLAINGGRPVRGRKTGWPVWPVVGKEEIDAIVEVTRSGNWSYNGPLELRLRQAWAEFVGTRYAVAAANGTVTLQMAWEALGIGFGDEVLVPGLTWQATPASVIDVNAVPVLVDVEEDSWCIDPRAVAAAITPRTKAIAAVHLYGTICDMDALRAIARKHALFLVEDAAHQHGSTFKGKKVGAIGDIGSFSLQQSKVFTAGEGGLLTTNSRELTEKLDALRNCGRRPVEAEQIDNTGNYVSVGNFIQSGNYRMTEFQAAVLLGQLKRLPEQVALRDRNARYLNGLLGKIEGIRPMRRQAGTEVQSYFNFAFRYDASAFQSLPVEKFRAAMSAELGFPFTECYEPLNACDLYVPATKPRHALSAAYRKAIDPARFDLPVSRKAFAEESVCCHHRLLLTDRAAMDQVAEAVVKIRDRASELLETRRGKPIEKARGRRPIGMSTTRKTQRKRSAS